NGVLPCGMVYMALASAMNADGVGNSLMFMLLFGLGTLPLMLLFSFAAHIPRRFMKGKFTYLMTFLYIFMGIWFILRGANLDKIGRASCRERVYISVVAIAQKIKRFRED